MTAPFARLTAALADRYRVDRELGAGGMATVYLTHDLRHERDVAIKVLHPDLGAALGAERFLAEIKTTAKLQHPHILPLLDSGAAAGLLYYVMPYVRGETLRARLERERQLPIPEALRIAREVAGALEHAHKQGIVHRDIKPENVLLQDGAAVVADFGIALAVQQAGGQRMTQTGLSLGTPQYMSPEQAMGERTIDARSDIYALGAVTYEMLAGEPPFTGASTQAIVAKVLSERPTPLSTLRDSVTPSVERAVMSALSRAAADRPATAMHFADALTLSGTSSATRPLPPTRRRVSLAMIVGAVIAGGALFAAGTWTGNRGAPRPAGFDRMVRLTDDEGVEAWPAISPDGASLAYASRRRGSWDLYVQRIGGRTPLLVAGDSTTNELFPSFSPDGQRIAYANGNRGIWVVEATGENARRIAPRGYVSSWSPDGSQLVYETESSEAPLSLLAIGRLERVTVATGTVQPLPTGSAPVYEPAWSPDGKRIAMTVLRGEKRDIQTVPAEGGVPVLVTDDASLDLAPEWSADGRFLFFVSNRGGSFGIWRIEVNGRTGAALGAPELVAAGADAAFDQPKVARKLNRLVFRAETRTVNLGVAQFDTARRTLTDARAITNRTSTLIARDLSADDRQLTLSSIQPPFGLWLMNVDGSNLRQVTSDGARDINPSFMADGRLLFYSNRSGSNQAYRISADGSGLEQLTDIAGQILYPLASKDGSTLFLTDSGLYVARVRGPWPAKRDRVERLAGASVGEMPMTASALSPDERFLAGFLQSKNGVEGDMVVYDVALSRLRRLDARFISRFPAWLPDSRRFLTALRGGGYALVNAETGAVEPVNGSLSPGAYANYMLVSHDGKRVYYNIGRQDANVWMLEQRRVQK